MENTESWNTFTRTGSVSDYLNYVSNSSSDRETYHDGISRREERGQCEGTSDGNGAFGSNHW